MTPSRQLLWSGIGLATFLALIWIFNEILAPFVIAMAIAYFLDPVCDRIQRLGISRTWATAVVTLVFLIVVALLLGLLVPLIVSEVAGFVGELPTYFKLLRERVLELGQFLEAKVDPAVLDRVREALAGSQERLSTWAAGLASEVLSGGVALFNLLSLLLITPIVTFYLLRDWDRLLSEADSLLPPAYAETIREQLREVDRTLSGFVRGVGTVCLLLGAFYAICLTLAGLNFGLVIGILAGLVSFVPFVGAVLGFLASIGMALLQFDSYVMIGVIAAIFFVGQFLEGNILQPTLVGERVGLHPVWVIFALLAGGLLFGFVGVLIAVPTAAVVGVGVRFAVNQYRARVINAPVGADAGGGEAS